MNRTASWILIGLTLFIIIVGIGLFCWLLPDTTIPVEGDPSHIFVITEETAPVRTHSYSPSTQQSQREMPLQQQLRAHGYVQSGCWPGIQLFTTRETELLARGFLAVSSVNPDRESSHQAVCQYIAQHKLPFCLVLDESIQLVPDFWVQWRKYWRPNQYTTQIPGKCLQAGSRGKAYCVLYQEDGSLAK